MAQRPIELPWLRQPTEQAGINWSNPLTRGLVRLVAWRGIEAVDLVTGAALNRVSTGFAAAVLSDGEGSSNTNESSYWELPITTEARNSLSMGWVGLHSGGSVPITVRDSSSSFGTILFWRNGGGWQTRAGGTGGSVDIAAAGAFAIGRIYAACTSIGASTARVHVDGAQVTSGSTSGSSGILLSPWVLHHNGAISGAALASSLLLAVWDRDLTATEAQSFTGRPWQLFKDQIIWVPVSTGSSDVTAPSVSASFAWAATASQPIVDTLAPAVGASITWAASAPVPLVDILAPSAAAAFAWAANASTPAIEDGAVVAPEVSSSFAWSATAAAPIVDVLAPGVSAAWTWQANPSAPIVQSDIAAPAVGAQVHWAAHALAPNIEGDHETIGSYDDAPWPSLPVRVRAAAPARFSWRANATRPRISVPPRPVAAPVAQATMRWTGSDARPRGLLLTRTGAPAAAPAAWPVRFCSHCGAPVERALH